MKKKKVTAEELNKLMLNRLKNIKVDYVQKYDNALSKDLCEYFIKKHKEIDKKGLLVKGRFDSSGEGVKSIDKSFKDSREVYLVTNEVLENYKQHGTRNKKMKKSDLFNVSEDEEFLEKYNQVREIVNKHLDLYLMHVGYFGNYYMGITKQNMKIYIK